MHYTHYWVVKIHNCCEDSIKFQETLVYILYVITQTQTKYNVICLDWMFK